MRGADYFIQAAYLAASVLFILGLKGLSSPAKARRGMFQAELGMGPSELARTLRLRRAYDLLVDTRQPISEVALDTGFADGSHFSRRFRDAFGKSPSEVRREAARLAREA